MAWQYTPFTLPLVLAAVVSLATAVYVAHRAANRLHTRLVLVFLLMATGGVLWSAGYAFQISSTTLGGKLLWNDVVWLGVTLMAVHWALFAFEVAGVQRVFRPRWLAVIAAVPVVTLVAALTDPYHAALMSDPRLVTTSAGFLVLGFDPSPLLLVNLVVVYVLDLATLVVLAMALGRSSGTARREFAVLLGVGTVPFLGSLSAATGVWPVMWVDPTPVLFALTSVVFGWVLVRHHLFDIVPTARRTVVEDLQDGIVVTDASRRVLDANRTAESVLAGSENSIYGARLGVDVGPDGVGEAFDDPGVEVPVEATVDGESRVYDLRVDTVVNGFVGVLRDRTDARRAHRRFQTLIERTDTLVTVLDDDGTIEYASPSYESVLGYDPAALEGTAGFDLVHPEDRDKTFAVLQQVHEDDRPRQLTVRVRNDEGEWRDVMLVGQNLKDDPTIGGLVSWGTDVTEQRRYEQRLRVLNRVLRHDLRNDMNVVGGYASLLADHDDPDVARAAAIIDRKVGELTELSEKARVVENSLTGTTQQESVDLVALVTEQLASLSSAWPEIIVGVDLPERAAVEAHPLLSSALDNVLENAVEHNDADHPSVEVRATHTTVRGDAFVDLVVADDGPGIPAAERDVVLAGSESSLEHSSGLGLWLVNWVVTQSRGEFDVADTGEGTTVTIRLPAVVDDDVEGTSAVGSGGVADHSRGVEDDDGVVGI